MIIDSVPWENYSFFEDIPVIYTVHMTAELDLIEIRKKEKDAIIIEVEIR